MFAGALHVDLNTLKDQKYIVSILAFFGTFFSTVVVGYISFKLFGALGLNITFIQALVFGAVDTLMFCSALESG